MSVAQEYAPSAFLHDQVYARVARVGRWTWRVRILVPTSGDGLGDATFTTDIVFGRRRAERLAARLVKLHVRYYAPRDDEAFEVRRDVEDGKS